MKAITTCKNQQIIFGHVVPTGAVYGKFTYSYDRHVKTGYKFITDKDGNKIFNKNGTPKMRILYKEVPTKNTVVYSVESFHTFGSGNHMFAWILYENSNNWREIPLGDTPTTKALEKMVCDYIKEHDLKEPAEPHVKTKNIRTIAPKFRQANQFDPVFRMRPEYSGTINEEVRPRMPIVHTNMDKLHPLDDRPIYTPKNNNRGKTETFEKYCRTTFITIGTKTEKVVTPIKDTVCNNPANDGYIRHADGTVTTRDGKTIKTGI